MPETSLQQGKRTALQRHRPAALAAYAQRAATASRPVLAILTGDRLDVALLTNQAANTDGIWQDCRGISPLSVHVNGITDATVQIRVSMQTTQPANSVHALQGGFDITADAVVTLEYPAKWIKARVLNYVAGTINAQVYGRM